VVDAAEARSNPVSVRFFQRRFFSTSTLWQAFQPNGEIFTLYEETKKATTVVVNQPPPGSRFVRKRTCSARRPGTGNDRHPQLTRLDLSGFGNERRLIVTLSVNRAASVLGRDLASYRLRHGALVHVLSSMDIFFAYEETAGVALGVLAARQAENKISSLTSRSALAQRRARFRGYDSLGTIKG
jgi:hypothetical protein